MSYIEIVKQVPKLVLTKRLKVCNCIYIFRLFNAIMTKLAMYCSQPIRYQFDKF